MNPILQRDSALNERARKPDLPMSNTQIRPKGRFNKLLMFALLVAFCAGGAAAPLAAADITEQQVKAGFVFNFVRFIEWPEAAMTTDQHLKLCLLGRSDVEREMENMMRGKVANGHAIDVSYIRGADEAQGCQVVFIDASERRKLKAGLPAVPGALVIGDFDGFARQGGTINFVMQDNKITFDINVAMAQRAGLKVSSRLLAVAHAVIE